MASARAEMVAIAGLLRLTKRREPCDVASQPLKTMRPVKSNLAVR